MGTVGLEAAFLASYQPVLASVSVNDDAERTESESDRIESPSGLAQEDVSTPACTFDQLLATVDTGTRSTTTEEALGRVILGRSRADQETRGKQIQDNNRKGS